MGSTGDLVIENADSGQQDEVRATISYVLPANVEILELRGSANLTGIGNDLPNLLIGNLGNNVLEGLGGNDVLTGGSSLGAGNDTLRGGPGDDIYSLFAAGQTVVELSGGASISSAPRSTPSCPTSSRISNCATPSSAAPATAVTMSSPAMPPPISSPAPADATR